MLRTLYIVKACNKQTPETVETFYLTSKLYWEVRWFTYKFNIENQRLNIYGVPNGIKLSKIVDVETFFGFKVNF